MGIEWKSYSDERYKDLEAHRGWHKCRGHNCEKAKELRGIWNDAIEREEKDQFVAGTSSILIEGTPTHTRRSHHDAR